MALATAVRLRSRPSRPLGLAVAAAVVVAIAVASLGRAGSASDPRLEGTESLPAAAFEEATGIRVVRVAATAAGGLLDVRYQVLDPDKALVVHDRERPPALRSERNGVVLARRWHDHVTTRELSHAVVYHELLVNSDGAVRSGDEVAVLIGDWRLEGVEVQ